MSNTSRATSWPCSPGQRRPAATGAAGEQALATKPGIPTLQPRALAQRLRAPGDKPLLLHVGFKKLYAARPRARPPALGVSA